MKLKKVHGALFAIVYMLAGGAPSIAAGWPEYYHHRGTGTRYYYDPASIKRSGPYTLVRQYDSSVVIKGVLFVFTGSIDCINRTIAPIRVDHYNAQSGAHIRSIDLAASTTRDPIRPRTMAAALHGVACR